VTFEKRCFVEPQDILSIRLRCANCGSILTVPLEQISSAKLQTLLAHPCSQCDKELGFSHGTAEMESFVRFNVMLSRLADVMKGRNLEYGFEVKCAED
jgi:hypothetical protein